MSLFWQRILLNWDKHPKKICDDENCDENLCEKRHPSSCKFRFCCKFFKTNICLFHMYSLLPIMKKLNINKLNEKVESFERKIEKMQTSLKEKDLQINELKQNYKAIETKLKNFEKYIG